LIIVPPRLTPRRIFNEDEPLNSIQLHSTGLNEAHPLPERTESPAKDEVDATTLTASQVAALAMNRNHW
jgi:hypothetical protein